MYSLIQLVGAVALLIWGTYMVKTGMLRAFGEQLRGWLAKCLTNRTTGFAAGFVLSSLLQSSTASALLVAGLQSKGLVTTAIALSSVLGADLGSAFMARLLSLDISAISPFLVTGGVFLFLRYSHRRLGQFGRVLIGLGLIMLALSIIMSATAPIKSSPMLQSVLEFVSHYRSLSLLLGAGLAFLCFSSLAVVIIVSSLAGAGVLTVPAALWMVLGANIGSAMLAVVTTMGGTAMARRAPMGNFVYRIAGVTVAVLALLICPRISELYANFATHGDGVIYFHLTFNALLGAVGLSAIKPVSRLVDNMLPFKFPKEDTEVQLLKEENLMDVATALYLTRQELSKSIEILEEFWEDVTELIKENPPSGEILLLRGKRKLLDRRSRAISRFLTAVMQDSLTTEQAYEWQRLKNENASIRFATDVADNIYKSLEKNKCRDLRNFSSIGKAELLQHHEHVRRNMALVQTLILSNDEETRQRVKETLAAEKLSVRNEEFALISSHMTRIAQGLTESVETSALHLELLTLFRRFNAFICSTDEFET